MIRRAGDRLRSAIRALINALPDEEQGISAMSRYLDVHKATCQRIVEGIERSGDGAAALVRFPGVAGLRLVVEAAQHRGVPSATAEAALSAIAGYEELLSQNGKTQRGLVQLVSSLRRNIDDSGQADDPASPTRSRRALFEAAREVSGEEVDVKAACSLMMPHPSDPKRLFVCVISSLNGVRRQLFSRPIVPFVLGASWSRSFAGATRSRPSNPSPDLPTFELLPDFSTPNLNLVKLEAADARTLLLVDLKKPADAPHTGASRRGVTLGPADVAVRFTTTAKPNPVHVPGAWLDTAGRITQPTRLLVIDIYVHTSLIADRVPVVGCYSLAAPPGDSVQGTPDQCWHERFPEYPQLQKLSRSRDVIHCPEFPRQVTLSERLFASNDIAPDHFAGFRCVVEYPLWQSEYRVYFFEKASLRRNRRRT